MATYYVDMAVGLDTNAGTSEGAGNAWKTIGKAISTIANNDKVFVKASADYTETCTMNNAATLAAPRIFEGYTTTPGDGGIVTINGASTRQYGVTTSIAANTNTYWMWKNFRCINHYSSGWNLTGRAHSFRNCHASSNSGTGFNNPGGLTPFFRCSATANAYGGFAGAAGALWIFCVAGSNTGTSGHGFYNSTSPALAYGCLSYKNQIDSYQFYHSGNPNTQAIIECTGRGRDSAISSGIEKGLNLSSATAFPVVYCVNCIFDYQQYFVYATTAHRTDGDSAMELFCGEWGKRLTADFYQCAPIQDSVDSGMANTALNWVSASADNYRLAWNSGSLRKAADVASTSGEGDRGPYKREQNPVLALGLTGGFQNAWDG